MRASPARVQVLGRARAVLALPQSRSSLPCRRLSALTLQDNVDFINMCNNVGFVVVCVLRLQVIVNFIVWILRNFFTCAQNITL